MILQTETWRLRRNTAVAGIGLGASLAVLLWQVWTDIALGGAPFRQGDWLINSASGYVRRAASGDTILALSDYFGASPVLVVCMIQAGLVCFVFTSVFLALWRLGMPDCLVLLALQPAFITFWSREPIGSLRKELWVVAAFCALLHVRGANRTWLVTATLLFGIGVFWHEAMVLFLPAFCVAFAMAAKDRLKCPILIGWLISLVAIAAVAGLLAVSQMRLSSTTEACSTLTTRGVDADMCDGAIAHLSNSVEDAREFVADWMASGVPLHFVFYGAATLATFHLPWPETSRPKWAPVSLILVAMPFAPLFPVAADWGRWLSFAGFSATFLLLLRAREHSGPERKLGRGVFWLALTVAWMWSVPMLVQDSLRHGPLVLAVSWLIGS